MSSLADLLRERDPVELLRNSQAGPNVYPGVPAEFTNWRDEVQAWQRTCVLFSRTAPRRSRQSSPTSRSSSVRS